MCWWYWLSRIIYVVSIGFYLLMTVFWLENKNHMDCWMISMNCCYRFYFNAKKPMAQYGNQLYDNWKLILLKWMKKIVCEGICWLFCNGLVPNFIVKKSILCNRVNNNVIAQLSTTINKEISSTERLFTTISV